AKGDLITVGAIGLGYGRKGRAAKALHAQKSVGECLLHLARNLFGCKVSEGESTGDSPLVRPCSDVEDAIVGAVEADGAQQLHRASSPDPTLMMAELSGSALAGPSSGRMMRPPSSSRPSTRTACCLPSCSTSIGASRSPSARAIQLSWTGRNPSSCHVLSHVR